MVDQVTSEKHYKHRRKFIKAASAVLSVSTIQQFAKAAEKKNGASTVNGKRTNAEKLTSFQDITTYNNYYEFGTSKSSPSRLAPKFLVTEPWSVTVEGLVRNPGVFSVDDLKKIGRLVERVYRMRCVEGWSMVIPWLGFPLNALMKKVEPTGSAKFVEFITLADSSMMPEVGAINPVLDWPYREGLRIDEASNPLTLLAFGLYGKELLPQNGAPFRLVVPWKYGFKSAKSLVKIRFIENMPITSWVKANPKEYGFYSNVNPNVPHRRWSQATERRIGDVGLFSPKRKTLMFNGYEEEVAHMYTGMNLKHFF